MDRRTNFRRGISRLLLTFSGLLLLTIAADIVDLDRIVSNFFYSAEEGFRLRDHPLVLWVYHHGTRPGLFLAIASLAAWLYCLSAPRRRSWNRYFLLIVLTALIGSGFLVNSVLKPYWGRPRPSQTQDFGGVWQYRTVFSPGPAGQGESFPSGHCAMGYLIAVLIFFRRKSPRLAYAGAALGILFGLLLSWARIAQGAHYLTDTVWSSGVILMTALVIYHFVLAIPLNADQQASVRPPRRRTQLVLRWTLAAILLVALGLFLARRPFYSFHRSDFPITDGIRQLVVELNEPIGQSVVKFKNIETGHLIIVSHGIGRPSATRRVEIQSWQTGPVLRIHARIQRIGSFSELGHDIEIWLPKADEGRLHVLFGSSEAFAAPGETTFSN